jgi:hypothetical protein
VSGCVEVWKVAVWDVVRGAWCVLRVACCVLRAAWTDAGTDQYEATLPTCNPLSSILITHHMFGQLLFCFRSIIVASAFWSVVINNIYEIL